MHPVLVKIGSFELAAKLLYIIVSWQEMGATFTERLVYAAKNFRYGFVFFGGAVTAIVALLIYLKKKKLPLLKTADFLIVGLPLGHAFGRIGCFLAGCCYGRPTDLPWGVTFTDPHSLVAPQYLGTTPLHPTQLYEVAANLILFFVLQYYYKKTHKNGAVLAAYIIGYCVIRFVIEFFRGDFRGEYLWGLSPSQLIAVLAIAVTLAAMRFLKKDASHAG